MATGFKRKNVKFTLKDIGSEIIDQLSSDIYSGPGSVIRELVKNAYDAYLRLSADELEDESFEREIVVSRERDAKGMGHLLIADRGAGMTLDELKQFVQISLSKKEEELDNATGFRGLGSWATIAAGSKIIVISNKRNHPFEAQLLIDVRRIYKKMGPATTLDDILNDPECISFWERESEGESQGTTVEVVCDGEPTKVNGHELNRLYQYTDPAETDLRTLMVQTCPIPFSSEGGAYKTIHEIYRETGYIQTHVVLDGDRLERGLPDDLPEPTVHEIVVTGKVVAKAWVTTSSKYTGEVRGINEDRHLLGGPSIQLMKLNVPIGSKGIHSNGVVRSTILPWYVGEVHLMAPDLRPDAGGQDLRAGIARGAFIESLQAFYKKLEEQAERKSEIISMARKLRQGMEAVEELKDGAIPAKEKPKKESKVALAVEILETSSRTTKPKTALEERQRLAAKDPQVEELRKKARKVLKEEGWIDKFATSKKRPAAKAKASGEKKGSRAADNGGRSIQTISLSEFQARLGRSVPRFAEIGLTQTQIEQVLEIIREVIMTD